MLPVYSDSSSSDIDSQAPRSTVWRQRAAGVAGVVALVGCVACVFALNKELETPMSARDMLESRDLAEVVADQYMKVGQKYLHSSDRAAVVDHVQSGFKEVSDSVKSDSPTAARQLQAVKLSPEQQRSVLHAMGYLGDARVQAIGHEIQQAAFDARKAGSVADAVHEKLGARRQELRALAAEIFPGVQIQRHQRLEDMYVIKAFDAWHGKEAASQIARKLEEDQATRVKKIGSMRPVAQVFMDHMEQLDDRFHAPQVRRLDEADLMTCFEQAMETADISTFFSCCSSTMSDSFESMMAKFGFDDINIFAPTESPITTTAAGNIPAGWR